MVGWGDQLFGGSSDSAQKQLSRNGGVRHICSTCCVLAALMRNFQVIVWGDKCTGGDMVVEWGDEETGFDITTVQTQLHSGVGVQRIYSTAVACAASTSEGKVVTWGADYGGGDSSDVQDQIADGGGVKHISSSRQAFAAVLVNGGVVTWGDSDFGGDSREVKAHLSCNE